MEEGSHRARWGEPPQLYIPIDVGGVAGEGESFTPSKDYPSVGFNMDWRRSDGDCKEIKTAYIKLLWSTCGGHVLDFSGNLQRAQICSYSTRFYLVSLSRWSHAIWRAFRWVFPCKHSILHRPFACCGWRYLAPGFQYTGDQRPALRRSMFPSAGCPYLDQLPGRWC